MLTLNIAQKLYQTERSRKSYQWSIVIGNLLEHFDSSLYGFLAPLLGKVFFPDFSPLYQLILAYSVYVITFVARPLGGVFFSKLTYRYGPWRTLLASLMGVAMATGLMGLIPEARQIGILAPCLLICIRFGQSFCAAGESAIAGYYLIEKSSKNQQMPWSGIYQSSTVLGILMASSLSTLILTSAENENLWRVAFLLGFVLGIWGLWMRFHHQKEEMAETSSSVRSYERILPRLRTHWKLVLCLIPIYGFSYLVYSVPLVFLNPFLAQTTSIPLSTLMEQTSTLLWLDALLLPGIALLAHRFNWFKTLAGCAIFFTLGATILLVCLLQSSLLMIFIGRLVMVVGGVGFATALIPWTASLYPPRDKYLLHSVSYNMGSELFGRSTPAICLWLYALTNYPSSPLIYIVGLTIIALGLMLWLQFFHVGRYNPVKAGLYSDSVVKA